MLVVLVLELGLPFESGPSFVKTPSNLVILERNMPMLEHFDETFGAKRR